MQEVIIKVLISSLFEIFLEKNVKVIHAKIQKMATMYTGLDTAVIAN